MEYALQKRCNNCTVLLLFHFSVTFGPKDTLHGDLSLRSFGIIADFTLAIHSNFAASHTLSSATSDIRTLSPCEISEALSGTVSGGS